MNTPSVKVKSLGFAQGFFCIFKGFKAVFTDKVIFIYTLIPILLSFVVMYFAFYYGFEYSSAFIKDFLVKNLSDWFSESHWVFKSLYWFVNIVVKILISVALLYAGFFVVQIFSIPFYSLSCEYILTKNNVFPDRPFRVGTWVRTTLRLFVISMIRMVIFLLFGLAIFVLSFIPGLAMLSLAYSALVVALDSMDYTLEIYELSLGRRFGIYFDQFSYFAGLSVALLPTLFIPGLTILFVPLTVIGSAVCFAERLGKYEYEKFIA